MTTKKYLSEKKTSTQNISISPALKDWIMRYVKKMHDTYPENPDYKSISAFQCAIMERVLTLFEKGKDLEDFDRLMDKEVNQQYSSMSGNLFLPLVEDCSINSAFENIDYFANHPVTSSLRAFYRQKIDPRDVNSAVEIFERVKKRYLSSGSTLRMELEKDGENWVLTHVGTYTYGHYVNEKFLAGMLGLIGNQLLNVVYSKEMKMFQLTYKPTDLYYSHKLQKKKRSELFKENVKFFTNYYRVLEDNAKHTWIKLADDQELIVSFRNSNVFKKKMEQVETDILNFGLQEDLLKLLLRFFENIHWIYIVNESDLSFKLIISKENHPKEIECLFNYLSDKGSITEEDGKYYFS